MIRPCRLQCHQCCSYWLKPRWYLLYIRTCRVSQPTALTRAVDAWDQTAEDNTWNGKRIGTRSRLNNKDLHAVFMIGLFNTASSNYGTIHETLLESYMRHSSSGILSPYWGNCLKQFGNTVWTTSIRADLHYTSRFRSVIVPSPFCQIDVFTLCVVFSHLPA